MKDMMDKAKNSDNEIDELWFEDAEMRWWNKNDALFRFLKR